MLDDTTSLNETYDHHDDGDDQKNVNEAAHGVAGYEAKQPKDDENDDDGPEHFRSGLVGFGGAANRVYQCYTLEG